jgi:hypothetical protein
MSPRIHITVFLLLLFQALRMMATTVHWEVSRGLTSNVRSSISITAFVRQLSPASSSQPSKRPLNRSPQSTDKSRGGKVRNMYRKVKNNIRKTLSPASVDKSVNKVALPSKYLAFLYL